MTHRFSHRIGRFLVTAVTVIQLVQAAPLGGRMPKYASNADPGVLPPQSRPYALTYGEWSARWWQWAFSLPVHKSPLFGTADCSEGQSGPVWFLPGAALGGPTPRQDCTIPAGKALFVAIINAECSNLEGSGETEGELRDCADSIGSLIESGKLRATLDGQPLNNLSQYQVESPMFYFGPLPDDDLITHYCIDQPESCLAAPRKSTGVGVGVGVYVMLRPLAVGPHKLEFHGEIQTDHFVFVVDTQYHLIVRP
ncbi:MAG: hypothetical protein ABJF23_00905 [Bryobacteraceae bacterium]